MYIVIFAIYLYIKYPEIILAFLKSIRHKIEFIMINTYIYSKIERNIWNNIFRNGA